MTEAGWPSSTYGFVLSNDPAWGDLELPSIRDAVDKFREECAVYDSVRRIVTDGAGL